MNGHIHRKTNFWVKYPEIQKSLVSAYLFPTGVPPDQRHVPTGTWLQVKNGSYKSHALTSTLVLGAACLQPAAFPCDLSPALSAGAGCSVPPESRARGQTWWPETGQALKT